jgi:NAD(P)-dependent dehydrogenase (short-subunit alcohol dehydrogenase family)
MFLKGDHADEAFNWALTEATVARWGKVNCLVNNAFSFTAAALDATREDWLRSLLVGPVAYATMGQAVLEPMKTQGGGAIVNVSSISAHIVQPNRWTYHSAKGAVLMLTKSMAYDMAVFNIRVNCVSPAWIWTREVQKAADLDGGGREKWEPIWGEFHMLRRCAEPIEVAAPVLFLLSDDASFITATDLYVDGGYLGMGAEGIGKLTKIAGSR